MQTYNQTVEEHADLITSLTPFTIDLMVSLRGPSQVRPSSVGPQEAE